jgi:hypothetical protein
MKDETRDVIARIIKGGVIGGIVTAVLGYSWATYKNNLNPVAGLGLVVLCSIGMTVGAVVGIFKKWHRNNEK